MFAYAGTARLNQQRQVGLKADIEKNPHVKSADLRPSIPKINYECSTLMATCVTVIGPI